MMGGAAPQGPGGPAVSQLSGQIAAPGLGAHSMLDGSPQSGGAPGQSMRDTETGASGAPGQSMKGEQGAAGAPGQSMRDTETGASGAPGQSMKGEQGGPGAPGQSMKGESGGPGAPGQSMKEDGGASGGPGQAAAAKDVEAGGASGGPGAGKAKAEPELKEGEKRAPKDEPQLKEGEKKTKPDAGSSGGPGAAKKAADEAGASGGPGAAGGPGAKKKDDDDLVDPDADRPNFGSSGPDEAEDEAEEEKSAMGMVRGGRASTPPKRKPERKPVNPAYLTVAIMGLAVLTLAGMIWLGRSILMQAYPQIAGFYQRMGVEPPKPGDGLRISESAKRLQRINGVETLVVRGFIANIADVPKTVPGLTLQLYNEKKEVIQDTSVNPPVGLLDPQGQAEYEIRLALPQLTAAKGGYGVVWTPAE